MLALQKHFSISLVRRGGNVSTTLLAKSKPGGCHQHQLFTGLQEGSIGFKEASFLWCGKEGLKGVGINQTEEPV